MVRVRVRLGYTMAIYLVLQHQVSPGSWNMLKMAEISSGRSLKSYIPRELKLGYVLRLQRLKNTSGNVGKD